jgi:hypothetical protein
MQEESETKKFSTVKIGRKIYISEVKEKEEKIERE